MCIALISSHIIHSKPRCSVQIYTRYVISLTVHVTYTESDCVDTGAGSGPCVHYSHAHRFEVTSSGQCSQHLCKYHS